MKTSNAQSGSALCSIKKKTKNHKYLHIPNGLNAQRETHMFSDEAVLYDTPQLMPHNYIFSHSNLAQNQLL